MDFQRLAFPGSLVYWYKISFEPRINDREGFFRIDFGLQNGGPHSLQEPHFPIARERGVQKNITKNFRIFLKSDHICPTYRGYIDMKKEKFVFIAISTVYTESIFTGGVEVSTTLRGLCRLIKGNYVAISKAWSRWEDKMICLEVRNTTGGDWKIYRKELDTVWGRGDRNIGKKLNGSGGFLGYKDPVSGLKSDQKPEKKRTLAEDSVVLRQSGGFEGVDSAYEEHDA